MYCRRRFYPSVHPGQSGQYPPTIAATRPGRADHAGSGGSRDGARLDGTIGEAGSREGRPAQVGHHHRGLARSIRSCPVSFSRSRSPQQRLPPPHPDFLHPPCSRQPLRVCHRTGAGKGPEAGVRSRSTGVGVPRDFSPATSQALMRGARGGMRVR